MTDRSILVTGGTGMLGHSLRKYLPQARYASSADGDLRDRSAALELVSCACPDVLIHLAARVGGVLDNRARNREYFEENILINTNTLHAAAETGVRHVIVLLSGCAWDLSDGLEKDESSFHAGLPFEGNLGYGFSKRALDVHARLLRNEADVTVDCLVPVTLFGPYDNFDPEHGHVVGALISKAQDALETRTPLDVWGTGKAVRQFVYAADAVRAIKALVEAPKNETLILAADDGITIEDLAAKVSAAVDFSGEVRFDPSKPEGVARKVLSGAKWRAAFPDFEFTPLSRALRETVDWYRLEEKKR